MKNSSSTNSFGSNLRKSVNKLTASASGVSLATSVLSASSEALNNFNSISDYDNNNSNDPAANISGPNILSQSLAVTNLIFGIYGIELWHYNEATGKLHNVNLNPQVVDGGDDVETGRRSSFADSKATNKLSSSGLFIKHKPQEADADNDYSTNNAIEAYESLTDTSRKDYEAASPVDPGVGLPGVLWSESSGSALPIPGVHLPKMGLFRHDDDAGEGSSSERNLNTSFRRARRGSGMKRRGSVGGNLGGSFRNKSPGGSFRGKNGVNIGHHSQLVWRNVDELANDPDQPYDKRLQTLAKAGFKIAAGIPFDINGYRGIVIMFGNPFAEPEKLNNPANIKFMYSAAKLIGSAAEMQTPLEAAQDFREELTNKNWRSLKVKMQAIVRFGGALRRRSDNGEALNSSKGETNNMSMRTKRRSSIIQASIYIRDNAKESLVEAKEGAKNKATRWGKKIRGGGAGIPPAFTWRQCLWTFIGVMTTHTILSRINLLIMTESDKELALILAPLGALTTLQYNLTAAPASQPRNAIFAQVFALVVTICLSYIPNIPMWFRSALAPAIVIPGMAKLGIIHPPAGAAAIVFSTLTDNRWNLMGIFLSGVAISIITAVGINNMSDRRQYPTSWYLISKARKAF